MKEEINIVVTSFKEPQLKRAIDALTNQKTKRSWKIIIVSPDKEAEQLVKEHKKKNMVFFKDPGKGKSYALNLLFKDKQLSGKIVVFTDGDVYLGENAIEEIGKTFIDKQVGCICGRIVSADAKSKKLGYWSHFLADAGAHRIRKELSEKNKFLECSGYLFAIRNGIIKKIPLDVAEDSIIPYYFWQKGYKIKYVEKALVFVKNPTTVNDWLKQRIRTAKAHETLDKYIDTKQVPRVKSLTNEIKKGITPLFTYPKSIKEFFWTMQLYFLRLYMWFRVYYETRMLKRSYHDAWERVESTK